MRARPRHRLHMSSDPAQGHRCCSELHEGDRSTSAQGCSSLWVALDIADYFFTDPQIPEGSTDLKKVAERDSDDAVFRINVPQPGEANALRDRLLYIQQHEPLTSKYLVTGNTVDFESWSSRFIWFIEMKSPRVANALHSERATFPA
eukprot:2123520-Alexandrium_andersonii.AAC.1